MQAIQWATNSGANVISMSLGIDFLGFVEELEGQACPPNWRRQWRSKAIARTLLLFGRLASLINAQNL